MSNNDRATILYIAAAINLAVGLWLLVGSHAEFVAGVISPLTYAARGIGPLILAATLIFLARRLRAKDEADHA